MLRVRTVSLYDLNLEREEILDSPLLESRHEQNQLSVLHSIELASSTP